MYIYLNVYIYRHECSSCLNGYIRILADKGIGVYMYRRLQQISAHGSWGRRAGPVSHQPP